ncbi:MAG TPA: MgtC/SapB family protein [Gemmatimonadales bacterium]|nr:MgtC/SapB family protein [Gemmatimonadales bacterium]
MNLEPNATPLLQILLRLIAAIVVGGAIGLNRDLREKPAGVRTHALVALGSALLVVLGERLSGDTTGEIQLVSRTVQGIITGIGFLGAGVILHPGNGRIRGLTTAATIWVTAALGIACGVGEWKLAGLATALTFVVLLSGGSVERLGHRLRPGSPGDDES